MQVVRFTNFFYKENNKNIRNIIQSAFSAEGTGFIDGEGQKKRIAHSLETQAHQLLTIAKQIREAV